MVASMGQLAHFLSDAGRNSEIPLVWQAYNVAERAHRRQRRISGEPYISHPVAVASIVAGLGGSSATVCAALLHDTIEDTGMPVRRLRTEFGPRIATMVEDVTSRAIRDRHPLADRELALLAVADRLHNLRTIRRVSSAHRRRSSLDTLVFHVPLAQQLDVPAVAAEMADLACDALDSAEVMYQSRRRRLAAAVRGAVPSSAIQAAAAFGGGAAVAGSGAIPEWALAGGGAGALAILAAALFGRDPKAAERLAGFIESWRRR